MNKLTIVFTVLILMVTVTHTLSDHQKFIDLVNEYRVQNNLNAIPSSYWLSATGMLHTIDRATNGQPQGCSQLSWQGPSIHFSAPCCYTSTKWECSGKKPAQISKNTYTPNAYENFVPASSPEQALEAWKRNPANNDVILNKGGWASSTWKAIGAGTCGGYYSLWFGQQTDNMPTSAIETLTCNMNLSAPLPDRENTGDPIIAPKIHTVQLTINETWTAVNLPVAYHSPVVVCSPYYTQSNPSTVIRLRNVGESYFEVHLQPTAEDADVDVEPVEVDCLILQTGTYTKQKNGVDMEVIKLTCLSTSSSSNWNATTKLNLKNSYTNPVVVGQVMTTNNIEWTSFFARGATPEDSVDANNTFVGKHVGEDPHTYRFPESLGVIVIEAGSGDLADFKYQAINGENIVYGVESNDDDVSPPYFYNQTIDANFGVNSVNSVFSGEGGFSIFFGNRTSAFLNDQVALAVDEDQSYDAERIVEVGESVGVLLLNLNK